MFFDVDAEHSGCPEWGGAVPPDGRRWVLPHV